MSARRPRRRAAWQWRLGPRRAFAVALALAAITAAGCGEPRSGAVSETGPCAQVIPLARARVGSSGHLVGVHALKRGQLRPLLRALGEQPLARGTRVRRRREHRPPRKGCVLIYRGRFAHPGTPGGMARYVILVISVRHPKLLADVAVDRIPRVVQRLD